MKMKASGSLIYIHWILRIFVILLIVSIQIKSRGMYSFLFEIYNLIFFSENDERFINKTIELQILKMNRDCWGFFYPQKFMIYLTEKYIFNRRDLNYDYHISEI